MASHPYPLLHTCRSSTYTRSGYLDLSVPSPSYIVAPLNAQAWADTGVTLRLSHWERGDPVMSFPNATPPRASSMVSTVELCTSPDPSAPLIDHVSCVLPLAWRLAASFNVLHSPSFHGTVPVATALVVQRRPEASHSCAALSTQLALLPPATKSTRSTNPAGVGVPDECIIAGTSPPLPIGQQLSLVALAGARPGVTGSLHTSGSGLPERMQVEDAVNTPMFDAKNSDGVGGGEGGLCG